MQPEMIADEVKVHPFERAGLGSAPFRFLGMRENVYSACPGHSQPGGTCDYCGTGIRYECVIGSADGRKFVVGTDCVRKAGDAKLVPLVASAERERKRKAREAKELARIQSAWRTFRAHRDAFSREPHPNIMLAKSGRTLADYVEFLNARGMRKFFLKVIEETAKRLELS